MKDQLYGADYVKEEDPTVYQSQKTRRGPLNENWLMEYWNDCKVLLERILDVTYNINISIS